MAQRPDDDKEAPPGGRAAERLKEFLERRLPPGHSPEELNPEAADDEEPEGGTEEKPGGGVPGKKPGTDKSETGNS
jgi:hypothetical protein